MNDSDLAEKLIRIQEELRDLKTAHDRGLGTTRFYKYTLQIYANRADYYTFIARVADGEPENPVIMGFAGVDEPIGEMYANTNNVNATTTNISVFTGFQIQDHTRLTIGIISSSKIGEFRQA